MKGTVPVPIPYRIVSYRNFRRCSLAIKKIILHKAPVLNGVSPNTIKALDDKNRNVLFGICYDFFNGNVEIEEW